MEVPMSIFFYIYKKGGNLHLQVTTRFWKRVINSLQPRLKIPRSDGELAALIGPCNSK